MHAETLFFTAPRTVEVRRIPLAPPQPGEVRVQTLVSGISAGTEMLMYRGQFPKGLAADATISALQDEMRYPFPYGYAAVGRVVEVGDTIPAKMVGQHVFSFQPHCAEFVTSLDNLIPLPTDIRPEQAIFLPNMETAVTFVLDAAPKLRERVVVYGQGVVGLLTTAILARFPLETLTTIDPDSARRALSIQWGATTSLPPGALDFPDADLVFELTGRPSVLTDAIESAGFGGRVVIGSWYGEKRAPIDLGGHFHRNRITLLSSQVSTLAPHLTGRWSKTRRFDTVWSLLREIQPEKLITHRFPLQDASQAYALLDAPPEDMMQVIFTYQNENNHTKEI
jgi:2-desacetyl-2-hydroxyethyl bacteriochlorophyllide A dehydrogenase